MQVHAHGRKRLQPVEVFWLNLARNSKLAETTVVIGDLTKASGLRNQNKLFLLFLVLPRVFQIIRRTAENPAALQQLQL